MELRRRRSVLLALLGAAVAGCSSSESTGPNCNNPLVGTSNAVAITVLDSATGAHLASGATGSLVAIGFSDSLHHVGWADSLLLGIGGGAIYKVTVQHAGYWTWVDSGVLVFADQCGGPITRDLTARLQSAP